MRKRVFRKVHSRNLIRAFTVLLQNYRTLLNISIERKCADEDLHMREMNLNLHFARVEDI